MIKSKANKMLADRLKIVDRYLCAKEIVIKKGFAKEIDWQNEIQLSKINEAYFLKEAAWVVLSSGMREYVIRKKFPDISSAFYFWQSSKLIVKNREKCKKHALEVFCHQKKINAIVEIAEIILKNGFNSIKSYIQKSGVEFIQTMPFMGPATSYHLAKNIGLDVVKPDRHLLRVADSTGFNNPHALCETISEVVGDRISVIDLVIWRFATLNPKYTEYFS